jgi:hypothetical protein
MARKDSDDELIGKSEFPATLSMETLMKMLLDQQRETAEANAKLAEAILESRKPYVDPKVLAQKQQELEDRRKQIARDQQIKINTKRICPHTRENGTPNIKWQEHSNGITMGVCGTCFSSFDTRNAADLDLLRKDLKSIRNMGRAGQHARAGVPIGA